MKYLAAAAFHIVFFYNLDNLKKHRLRLVVLELKFFESPHFANTFSVSRNAVNNYMPEYNNIQTCQIIENNNPISIFENYISFLKKIGINNRNIFEDLRAFELKFEDDFPFVYFMKERELTKYSTIPVIPYLSFYRDNNKYYAICQLLIETERIFNYQISKYTSETLKFIENISIEMFKSFKDSPIFFTDEIQDSIEIEKKWKSKIDNDFEFDIAIIPMKNSEYSTQENSKFYKKNVEDFFVLSDYKKF